MADNRLNVLMISPQFYPIVGGYERAAQRLSEELVIEGHNVLVVAERRKKSYLQNEITNGVEIKRIWCVY